MLTKSKSRCANTLIHQIRAVGIWDQYGYVGTPRDKVLRIITKHLEEGLDAETLLFVYKRVNII